MLQQTSDLQLRNTKRRFRRWPEQKLAAIRCPFLRTNEQRAIAAALSGMDAELAAGSERDKARAIKQGMMQELLTGRVRLI